MMGNLGEKVTDAEVGAFILQIFAKESDSYMKASELRLVMGNLGEKLTDAKVAASYCRYLIKIVTVI